MNKACILAAALVATLAAATTVSAYAADAVKIGAIYPLTGNAASAGQSAKDAVNLAAEIVNTAHPDSRTCRSERPAACRISAAPRSCSTRPIIKAIRKSASSRRCA